MKYRNATPPRIGRKIHFSQSLALVLGGLLLAGTLATAGPASAAPLAAGQHTLSPEKHEVHLVKKPTQEKKKHKQTSKHRVPANLLLQQTLVQDSTLKRVKLTRRPVLNPALFRNIKALDRVVIKNTKKDKTVIETASSGASNNITVHGKKVFACDPPTKQTLNITTSDFSYFTQSSTPDFIKPGVVIKYTSILNGKNTINTTPRDPLTIYLLHTSAVSGSNHLSVKVEDPQNVSNINNALGSLTGKLNTETVPANMSFEIMEINSEKELQYAISGSYSYGNMVSAQFGVKGGNFNKKHYYLIKFVQNMYSIAADPNTVRFNNLPRNSDRLAYVSEVTYGRKGLMMIKTNKSMNQIHVEMNVSANYGLSKGDIGGFINSVNRDSSSEIHVFFYGGSSDVAALSLQESDMKRGFDKWVAAEAGNGLLALPISYKVKNLKGEQLKLSSVFEQMVRNCVPRKSLKLKVTLLGIDPWDTRDSDDRPDYAVRQHLKYIANGKVKRPAGKVVFNTFKKNTSPCNLAGGKVWHGSIPLACGSVRDQIHPYVRGHNSKRRLGNIMNSVVFNLSPQEASDKNAKFKVNTWVKEYSGNHDTLMNIDFSMPQEVPIYFVLSELQGIISSKFNEKYDRDGSVNGTGPGKFKNFNSRYLALTKGVDAANGDRPYVDALLRARNSDSSLKEKAFLWLRFELVN